MDRKHKDILQKSCTYLLDNISNVDGICDELIQKEILDAGSADTILKKTPQPKGQIRELIFNQLPRRGPKAFDCFINALVNTNQDHIVDYLNRQLS